MLPDNAKLACWTPRLLDVVRIVAAVLLLEHGTQKLFAMPPPMMPQPAPYTLIWFAAVIEVVGGLLLALGLFTRPVAFLLSGEMAFAYFIGHAPKSFWPAVNGGDAAILFCFLFLYLSAVGAGPWSVDAMRGRSN